MTILQHDKSEFKPKRDTQKIDYQRLAHRRANAALAELQSTTDEILRNGARRAYLAWLKQQHVNGEEGSLLTADQMAQAQPERTPAEALLDKLVEARPDLAKRGAKAARLVIANAVTLTGQETALVTGDTGQYLVDGRTCRCRWQAHHPNEWCSHAMAVRMARALGQDIDDSEAAKEAAKEARSEARVRANREREQARLAARGENEFERRRRLSYQDGDGARNYVKKAYANGAKTFAPDKWHRATGGK